MFALSGDTTPLGYLTETLNGIRQEKTWGSDPLRVQLRGSHIEELLQEYLRQNPRDETGETTRIPVFLVELPPPPERRSTTFLPSAFLEQLGDPAAWVREPAESKTYRLEGFLQACQVELIIITRFHHLLSAKRQLPLRDEFNWILELIMHQVKDIPVVITGDESGVARLLGREFAIARRFFSITIPESDSDEQSSIEREHSLQEDGILPVPSSSEQVGAGGEKSTSWMSPPHIFRQQMRVVIEDVGLQQRFLRLMDDPTEFVFTGEEIADASWYEGE